MSAMKAVLPYAMCMTPCQLDTADACAGVPGRLRRKPQAASWRIASAVTTSLIRQVLPRDGLQA